jgi:uncharacterized protein YukE
MPVTPPEELDDLARALERQAAELDQVQDEIRWAVQQTRGFWEGLVADRFRSHLDSEHRQRHLTEASDRLRHAAHLARRAADGQYPLSRGGEG